MSGRLARFRTFSASTSVLMAIVLALFLLLLSEGVSRAAKPPSTADNTPPTVTTVAPANNATGVAIISNVEATFSEAINASTIHGSTFTLVKAGTTTPVAAQVTYDPAPNKATLDPNANLDPGATYTATVKAGNKGVKDLAGNWLRNNRTWSFTTAAAPPPPGSKIVALTFDDGPLDGDTQPILDILSNYGVKATFFVTGYNANRFPFLVRREYQEGHMVANHSYTHPHLPQLSSSEVEKELRDTNTAITAAGVPQPNLFRPPYGDTNATIEGIATSLGMTQVIWNPATDTNDWANPSASTICDRVLNGVSPGSIILLHDGGGTTNTDEALPCIITRLKEQGYTFGLIYPSSNYDSLNSSYVEIR